MTTIPDRLQQVKLRISTACQTAGRDPATVGLLAVSKTQAPEAVREAHAAGQCAFGENYIQEGVEKILSLRDLPLVWHMIGPVQSNKTRVVAEHFDWVQSVDRLKTAERLSAQRPGHLPPLNVCLQVNIDQGPNKSGVAPEAALALAEAGADGVKVGMAWPELAPASHSATVAVFTAGRRAPCLTIFLPRNCPAGPNLTPCRLA